jgi:hypothetical protein
MIPWAQQHRHAWTGHQDLAIDNLFAQALQGQPENGPIWTLHPIQLNLTPSMQMQQTDTGHLGPMDHRLKWLTRSEQVAAVIPQIRANNRRPLIKISCFKNWL